MTTSTSGGVNAPTRSNSGLADLAKSRAGSLFAEAKKSSASKIVVALPAYNEEAAIIPLLVRIGQTLNLLDSPWTVLVIDDGSRDDTVARAKSMEERYPVEVIPHARNMGLGGALMTCFREASSRCEPDDCIVILDADNTQPPELIPQMRNLVRDGKDIVIASRFRKGSKITGVPWHRNWMSFGARALFTIVFPIPGVRDYTCGFRAYRAGTIQAALQTYGDDFVSETGFSCMCDVLLKLRGKGVQFAEVPLELRYDQKGGISQMKVLKTVVQTLGLMVRRKFGKTAG